ncbi:major facilitator superfamily domain-containing protein [Dipodascopsis uninucleata]
MNRQREVLKDGDNDQKATISVLEIPKPGNSENPFLPDPQDEVLFNSQYAFHERTEAWHEETRKKLLKKLDSHILPIIIVMYLMNYLDRTNLSQARLGGLEESLRLKGTDINTLTSVVFIGYIMLQIPSSMIIVKVRRPSVYLGSCMALWGLVSALHGATFNYASMFICRFLLGILEAPFFPGILLLLSSWYTKQELAHRLALFHGGSMIGSMLGGLIAAAVLGNLDQFLGFDGWRWLFFIEGFMTIAVSITGIWLLPDHPGVPVLWLTKEEQEYAKWCLANDVGKQDDTEAVPVKQALWMALTDYKVYMFGIMLHAHTVCASFTFFFPSIVETLGHDRVVTLLMTVPVWGFGFLFSVLFCYHASRTNERTFHIVFAMSIIFIGYVTLTFSDNNKIRYMAMFLLPMGSGPCVQIVMTWLSNTVSRPTAKRSTSIALCNLMNNSASIYAAYLFPASDAPRYLRATTAITFSAILCIIMALSMRSILLAQNKRLDRLNNMDEEERQALLGEDGNEDYDDEYSPDKMAKGFRYIV